MVIVADQAKLVLKAFAAIFQNNLISKDLVTWNQYAGEFEDTNNLTVAEQVGPRYVVTRSTGGVQDLSGGIQTSVFGSEQFRINDVFGASMGYGDVMKIQTFGDARESVALKNAAINLAEQIDAYILGFCAIGSNNWLGTPGATIDTFDKVAAGYTRLKEEGASDADLRAVLSYGDKQALGNAVVSNNASLTNLGDGIYRQGFSGEVAGISTMFTQQLPTLISGTRTNGTVNGAGQNVNYSAVAASPAPGQYMTQLLNVSGLGANATVNDGEVLTLAGVFAYDNRLQGTLNRLQQFRVVGQVTANGTGDVALRIFPAIIVPGAGTTGDPAVNRANATVNAAPAAGAVVTFATPASSGIRPRVIMNREAVVVNTADLIIPFTGVGKRQKLDQLPISVRMWWDSTFATGNHRIRFDTMLTANMRDRRRLVRFNG